MPKKQKPAGGGFCRDGIAALRLFAPIDVADSTTTETNAQAPACISSLVDQATVRLERAIEYSDYRAASKHRRILRTVEALAFDMSEVQGD